MAHETLKNNSTFKNGCLKYFQNIIQAKRKTIRYSETKNPVLDAFKAESPTAKITALEMISVTKYPKMFKDINF